MGGWVQLLFDSVNVGGWVQLLFDSVNVGGWVQLLFTGEELRFTSPLKGEEA